MFRKILIIFNPVTIFLLLNIISPKEISLYEKVIELDKIEYVNTGSSHGQYAFNYKYLKNSINLGFGAQRMYYGLKVLESVEPFMDVSSTIIIPVSIFSFCGYFDGPKQRYLGFLSRDELNISFGQEMLELYFPYLGIDKIESIFNRLIKKELDFVDNGVDVANFNLSLARECNIIDDSIVEQLKKFIERNIEKNIVFIITPYYHTYWEEILIEREVVEKIYDTVNDIVDDYSLVFLDYSEDDRFKNNPKLFVDSDHLNNDGAILFTKIVIDELTNVT